MTRGASHRHRSSGHFDVGFSGIVNSWIRAGSAPVAERHLFCDWQRKPD